MARFIITEKQLGYIQKSLLKEAVGVPEGIIDSAKKLYDTVLFISKNLRKTKTQTAKREIDLNISGVKIKKLEVVFTVETVDWYNEDDITVSRFGVINDFKFNEDILLKVNDLNDGLIMILDFISKDDEWSPQDIYKTLAGDKTHFISIFAHELKHKFDKQKKVKDLIVRDINYFTVSNSGLSFGIPAINDFMKYSYYIHTAENLVRPTEVATRMKINNIKKEEFLEFLKNDIVFKELNEIRNFTYENLVQRLEGEEYYIDKFLDHINYEGIEDLTLDQKINVVLRLVYVNLVNTKLEAFEGMTNLPETEMEGFLIFLGMPATPKKRSKEFERFKEKFFYQVIKYENREIDFFKDECDEFVYVATKLIKKISKIYSLIDDNLTNESILDWDLHQKLMEKRNGKRKIDTEYKKFK